MLRRRTASGLPRDATADYATADGWSLAPRCAPGLGGVFTVLGDLPGVSFS
jgi:hypothetical protein